MTTSPNLTDLLTAAVRNATGIPDASPRPGQARLAADIDQILQEGEGHVAGKAGTGVGKSLAYLVPAARLALMGERTVISTESLGLQHQITDKDFPVVAKAVREATGVELEVAVHKGWSNFACLQKAADAAREVVPARVAARAPERGSVAELREGLNRLSSATTMIDPLLSWTLAPVNESGDRAEYPHRLDAEDWGRVSVTPDECEGANCPLLELCFPERAKRKAAAANVIVTNHSMLAVQAAKGVPVVVGSKALGQVDAVIIDEAHTLPGIVRDMGAVEVSERRVLSAVRTLSRALPETDEDVKAMCEQGRGLADQVAAEVAAAAKKAGGSGKKIPEDYDPLAQCGDRLADWCKKASSMILSATATTRGSARMQAKRDAGRIQSLGGDVADVRTGDIGVARWVQMPEQGTFTRGPQVPTLCLSPVDVSGPLRLGLWTTPQEFDEDEERGPREPDGFDEAGDPIWNRALRHLPVAAVSATLPSSFPFDAGLRASIVEYESPFASAYDSSLLYVPRARADGLDLPVRSYGSRSSLDTQEHPKWAVELMKTLIEAAGGRAIVLSATSSAGRFYAEALRRHAGGRWQVHSQWDGRGKEHTTRAWRADETAVLVGTRSYMTGVDAPGRTCSLVIVDRVPRGAANVVDDARVDVLAQDMNEHRARDMVYAVDAAQLLEQAAGRLIRSTSDRGVVAVLDPRLLKKQPVTYPGSTRSIYMGALEHFTTRTARLSVATDYLISLCADQMDTPKAA